MRIFTIKSGVIEEGAEVTKLRLSGAGVEIPAILVGESGRGRELGVLPVQLTFCQLKEWQEKGKVVITSALVGQTKAGKPKLIATDSTDQNTDEIVCVFRTKIGFRGGNDHTGDREGEEEYKNCYGDTKTRIIFKKFPGRVIASGTIAQGIAGRMGSGEQIVAIMPKGVVFRTAYSGRLYGEPDEDYYIWTGTELMSATWDERISSEIF